MDYPDRHHPVFFLQDALISLGAAAVFNGRDDRTLGCWGLIVNGKPLAWLIDNRHEHERVKEDPAAAELLKRGALVACAQKPDAERVGGKWLPLAVTPGYRPPDKPIDKLYDVGFVGYVRDTARMQVLSHVARHFKLSVAQGVFGDSAVATYWQSKIGLNVPTNWPSPTSYDSANMRLFEILATRTPLVTPYEPYLAELGLIDYLNCMMYRSADELMQRIGLILSGLWSFSGGMISVDLMTRAGTELVQQRHTYAHRAVQVLEWLK